MNQKTPKVHAPKPIEKLKDKRNWANIHPEFNEEKEEGREYVKNWVWVGFTYDTCKEWIDIGMKPNNYDWRFCAWIRDKKGWDALQVLNHVNIDELRKEWENSFVYF